MDWQQRNQQTLQRGVAVIRQIPFTRAVILTGSVAEDRAQPTSDIDLFVQVKPGHLWSTRFFSTALLQLAGLRRTDTDITGKLCLNWYATFNAPAEQQGRVHQVLWQEEGPSNLKRVVETVLNIFVEPWLQPILKAYQIRRIEHDPRTHISGSQVRYSDTELGFHPPKPQNVKRT